jgi:hypothetical protein
MAMIHACGFGGTAGYEFRVMMHIGNRRTLSGCCRACHGVSAVLFSSIFNLQVGLSGPTTTANRAWSFTHLSMMGASPYVR